MTAIMTAISGIFLYRLFFSFIFLKREILILSASTILSAGIAFVVPGLIETVISRTNFSDRGFAMALYSFTLFLGASLASPFIVNYQYLGFYILSILMIVIALIGIICLQITRKSPINHH